MNQHFCQRHFLGLKRPPLVSAIGWLLETYQKSQLGAQQLDLSSLLIVVPTQRAKKRLLQLLVEQTGQQSLLFSPPTITTLGNFPEYLYVADLPLANQPTQQLAWAQAIEQAPAAIIEQLTGRSENIHAEYRKSLAQLIIQLHTRLANDIWSFRSVYREVQNLSGFLEAETGRWEALAAIQETYYQILQQLGLWDKQAARNYAAGGIKAGQNRCTTDRTIIMLSVADLNRSIAAMLQQVVNQNPNQVNILIAADQDQADRFDSFGSLISERWIDETIDIQDRQIKIVDQPADQAHAAAHFISQFSEKFTADQITLGIPDEAVLPALRRNLNLLHLPHRNLAGQQLDQSLPARLLLACREYLESFRYEALAALVRQPDLFDWISRQVQSEQWLNHLTELQNESLLSVVPMDKCLVFGDPATIRQMFDEDDPASKRRAEQRASQIELLNQVMEALRQLLAPVTRGDQHHGADAWRQVLLTVYADRDLHLPDDQLTVQACEKIEAALQEQQRVPTSLAQEISATEALGAALEIASQQRLVPTEIPGEIELAGWLDLTLDDAPAMAITGMNDSNVPASEHGHPFLPNELCKKLGILDNDRRFARDHYALSVITAVRENLLLIVGRRDLQGEPLKPSRLLFATDGLTAAKRARAFFSFTGNSSSRFWLQPPTACAAGQKFVVPPPFQPSAVEEISVTKFREYLKCPYRFYLRYILRLETVSDDLRELDAGMFGDLTHQVLESFGRSAQTESTNEDEIFEFFNERLDQFAESRFGPERLPAVRIQIEQIRIRLQQFSVHQAQQRREGWRIVSTEEMLKHPFIVDGEPFSLIGKIDRVDQHERTGKVAVWDYKTSDKGDSPEAVHYASQKNEWKDLQLPLYRHLAQQIAVIADADLSDITMGYILLCKDSAKIGFSPANWDAEKLDSADQTAAQVIRNLRQSHFWPPTPEPPLYSDDLAAICMDHVFEQAE